MIDENEYLNNEKYFHDYYTDIEISRDASVAHPKSAIQICNREMVDHADLIICCINTKEAVHGRLFNML